MDDLEQRASLRSQMRNVREVRRCPADFEYRVVPNGTGGANVIFTGYASVTGDDATYEMEDWLGPWTESVSVGAFAKTLSDKADVAFLINHEGLTLARTKSGTLSLAEHTYGSPTGLHVEASLDDANLYVQALRSAVDRRDVDEMSFAFRVTRQEWNEDYTRRWINEVNMSQGDVSAVNFGANPHTGGTVGMRSAEMASAERLARAFASLYEQREGHALPAGSMSELSGILALVSQADDGVEPGQLLSALMGVPNLGNDEPRDELARACIPTLQRAADVQVLVRRNREREAKLSRRAA